MVTNDVRQIRARGPRISAMSAELIILVLLIATALAFDFTNGFHDTGNAMATSIATGALKPKVAVLLAGVLNLVGAFLSVEVAATVTKDDGGASITQGLIAVTLQTGFPCTSYGMCVSAVGDKQSINYTGPAGQINYDPTTGVAYFGKTIDVAKK